VRATPSIVAALVATLAATACGRFGIGGDDEPGDDTPDVARITITVSELGGTGMVVGNSGISCSTGMCEVEVEPGTELHLRGLAQTGAWFRGWRSPACGGNFGCDFTTTGQDVEITAEFYPRPNRMFVSSSVHAANFTDLAVPDQACAARAAEAGLDGTWIAYVSSSTRHAADRLAASRGFIRMDGAPIADTPARFAQGPLSFVPRFDEMGFEILEATIFTGTWGETPSDGTCQNWTSNLDTEYTGVSSTTWGTRFAYGGNDVCSAERHFLCVETGKNVASVQPIPDTGKISFLSTALWAPGPTSSVATADAICQTEAENGGFTGTFLAALATTTKSIAERFEPGSIWTRPDGVRLLRSDELFTTNYLDVAPELDLSGAVILNDYWTGTDRFSLRATPSVNCNDWTDNTTTRLGAMHFTSTTDVSRPAKYESCATALPLLCLQSE
jgi:hypothetical protein